MEFYLSFKLDNAAFAEDEDQEISRILRELANRVKDGDADRDGGVIRDINGNTVGFYGFKEK